jgi:SAM-dependent methyltransferase
MSPKKQSVEKWNAKRIAKAAVSHASALAARLSLLPVSRATSMDPHHQLFRRFVAEVNAMPNPRLVELGSRMRSGNKYTSGFRRDISYTGVDIIPGENVDMVADAHELSKHVDSGAFDAMFSISVFEHLAMPWKVVVELNKVLKTGGLAFVSTHPTYPPHERPWDFYRYSKHGMAALFNKLAGFEIVDVCEGLPCRIVPLGFEPAMKSMQVHDAFLAVAILARKIGPADPRLAWDVSLKEFLDTAYPPTC